MDEAMLHAEKHEPECTVGVLHAPYLAVGELGDCGDAGVQGKALLLLGLELRALAYLLAQFDIRHGQIVGVEQLRHLRGG